MFAIRPPTTLSTYALVGSGAAMNARSAAKSAQPGTSDDSTSTASAATTGSSASAGGPPASSASATAGTGGASSASTSAASSSSAAGSGGGANGGAGGGGGAGGSPTPLFVQVAAGTGDSCALSNSATVYCWGGNGGGALGLGVTDLDPHMKPTLVPNLNGVAEIRAGAGYNCARMLDGTVRCWGWNKWGQLGDGTTKDKYSPTVVPGLVGVVSLDASDGGGVDGAHACAAKLDGTVLCWGANAFGQLGDGTTVAKLSPTPVPGLTGVATVRVSEVSSCAVKTDGALYCWGRNAKVLGPAPNSCGDGQPVSSPMVVYGATDIVAVAPNLDNNCAAKKDGTVLCWGDNGLGQLGLGSNQSFCSPQPVPNLSGVVGLAARHYHTHAWKADGTVYGWGLNTNAQIGDGTTIGKGSPTLVSLTGIVDLDVGDVHGCAVQQGGALFCWGADNFGDLGAPTKNG